MKSKFVFCPNFENFVTDTVVFYVYVGVSQRDIYYKKIIDHAAVNLGWIFCPVGIDIDFELIQVSARLFKGSKFPNLYLRKHKIDIEHLVAILRHGDILEYSKTIADEVGNFKFLCAIDSDFYFNHHKQAKPQTMPTVSRKNLSEDAGWSFSQAIVGFVLMILIFCLGEIVCAIERLF